MLSYLCFFSLFTLDLQWLESFKAEIDSTSTKNDFGKLPLPYFVDAKVL